MSKNRRIETLSRAYSILTGQDVTSSRSSIMKTRTGKAIYRYNKCAMYESPAANIMDIVMEIEHKDSRAAINTQEIVRAIQEAEKLENAQVSTVTVRAASLKTKRNYYMKLKARKAKMQRSVKKNMLLLVKNKNGELETRDMLDIDFNMKVEHIGKNQFVLRINKSLVYPDTFPTREAAQDQMLAIVDMRNQLEQEALGW